MTKDYPWYTPYQFAGNTSIQSLDLDGAEEYHYRMTMNKQGQADLKLVSTKTYNHHSWLWGAIEFDTKINVKRYIVDFNLGTYPNRTVN